MTPEHTQLFAGEIEHVAKQRKEKGLTIAQALEACRKENRRLQDELGESLPDEKVREIVNGVYGIKPRKIFLNSNFSAKEEVMEIVWAVDHVLLASALNLFVGDPDVGKTLVAINYIAKLTRAGEKVVIISREDSYGHLWKPRLMVAGADLDLVIQLNGVRAEDEDGEIPWMLDNSEHLALVKELLLKEKPALFLIDPLADFCGTLDLNKQKDVRTITGRLNEVAQKTGTCILANTHTTKAVVDSAIKSASGSYQLMAAVAVAWLMMKDPDNTELRLMLQARNKYGKKLGFKYAIISAPYPENWPVAKDEDGVGLVEFRGKETRTADELLERNQDKDNGTKTQIRRWLNGMLKNGPVTTQQASEEMHRRNFNKATVTDVCIEMGISRDGKTWEMKSVTKIPKQEEIFNGVTQ